MRCCRTARASATSTARSWSRKNREADEIGNMKIAIPGELTSAFLALRLFNSKFEYVVYPFDQIIEAVQKGKVDAGLLIHEGQLFYKELASTRSSTLANGGTRRLACRCRWAAMRSGDLGPELMKQVSRHLHRSIMYSWRTARTLQYAMQFARDMAPEVADRFVAMWVNELTLDYGERGKEGVRRLLDEGYKAGIILHKVEVEFVD